MTKMIDVITANGTEQRPLLDLQEIMKQHEYKEPLTLSNGSVILFGYPTSTQFKQIKAKYHEFLRDYYNDALAKAAKIYGDQPKDVSMVDYIQGLSKEDADFLEEYELRSFPYQVEQNHAMLKEPTMSLEDFTKLIDILPPIDYLNMILKCSKILKKWAEDISSKNSDPPQTG